MGQAPEIAPTSTAVDSIESRRRPKLKNQERLARIHLLRASGLTCDAIARRLGYAGRQGVHYFVKTYLRERAA